MIVNQAWTMLQSVKWSKRYFWILFNWFWSNTVIKEQKQEHYINLPMNPLENPLATHPILMASEMSIEPYTNWQFGCADNPDHVFVHGLVLTPTRTGSGGSELLLIVSVLSDYMLTTIEYIPQWFESHSPSIPPSILWYPYRVFVISPLSVCSITSDWLCSIIPFSSCCSLPCPIAYCSQLYLFNSCTSLVSITSRVYS